MKRAIVTGAKGQDGTYLRAYLEKLGYQVLGIVSQKNENEVDEFIAMDLSNIERVHKLLRNFEPDEVYHLTAFHQSSEEGDTHDEYSLFQISYRNNVLSTLNLLDSIYRLRYGSKIFFASSSRIFGIGGEKMQNENSVVNPSCIYGITKSLAMNLCRFYRNKRDIFAAVGILYNHESPLRNPKFVCRKIIKRAVEIKVGRESELVIGDLHAEVDWGFAGDYVIAMHQILQLKEADDFIIASGKKHSVQEFIEEAFSYLGMDWKKYVRVEEMLVQRYNGYPPVGDNSKLKKKTGWEPKTDFREMIHLMIDAELCHELV